ncbi:hypothetical protein [Actinophytocola xinjiangensis]|uniref:hypothetical protein n=1 Tax=Actinophytocola xinjiangensis TaxID=485602 RepID=UPI0012B9F953|nr:hypothetical protein [Actinophytocola xinjiangensis]
MLISLADEATAADWIAAIGQAVGAVFTAAAVAVALWIALSDRRRQTRADSEKSWREARMVRVGGTGVREVGHDENGYQYELMIYFTNYSEQPIFDVHAEVWPSGTAVDKQPSWAVQSEIVQPGEPAEPKRYFMMKVSTPTPPPLALTAWRLRWSDAAGHQWCVDEPRQIQPQPFKGQAPRLY